MGFRTLDEINAEVTTNSSLTISDTFDPAALIDKAISSNLDPLIFDNIDESDIPRAKNCLEWCLGKEFLNMSPGPFGRQIQVILNLFQDYCPYCSDVKFATDIFDPTITEIYDRIQLYEFGVCPKCHKSRLDALNDRLFTGPKLTFAGCWGMRSGKTILAGSIISTYQLHKFLMLGSPSRFFGLNSNQPLHMTFTAITAGQAYETLWSAFKTQYEAAPWFNNYNKFLLQEGKKLGIEDLVDVKDSFVYYGGIKGLVFSYQGADIRTIRGRTRALAAIDELSWFQQAADATKVRANADETYMALSRSLQTIRSASAKLRSKGIVDVPTALNINISSPFSKNDALMRLIYDAKEDDTIYAVHNPTWEVNPNVPLSSLKSEMKNKIIFERDFGAIPPMADSPYLDDDKAIDRTQKEFPKYLTYKKVYTTDEFGDRTVHIDIAPLIKDKNNPYILTVDTGYTNNSYAIAVSRFDHVERKMETPVILEVIPEDNLDGTFTTVNFPGMFNSCISKLCDMFNIVYAVYDRWNSLQAIQELKQRKIKAEQYSLGYNDFINFKNRFSDNSILVPKAHRTMLELKNSSVRYDKLSEGHPETHLLLQFMTVREVGRRVEKPLGGTDDLFRCIVLAATYIFDDKINKIFSYSGNRGPSSKGVLGTVRSNKSIYNSGNNTNVGVRKSFIFR